jgi:hypothetical protein
MTPILYRPIRGSLKQSMKEVVEVADLDHLKRLIQETLLTNGKLLDVKIERYGRDERIKWDTYLVSAKLQWTDRTDWFPVGYTNGVFATKNHSATDSATAPSDQNP